MLDREHPIAITGRKNTLIGASKDQTRALFFRESALPRAFIASACRTTETQAQEMAFYRESNAVMQGEVVLPFDTDKTELAQQLKGLDCNQYQNTFERAPISYDTGSKIGFATLQGPALLLLNDSYYPGWRAHEEDGTELPIARANTNARAVYLPENRSYTLNMEYRPSWLATSLILLGLCLPALWLLGLLLKSEHKKHVVVHAY